MSDLIACTLCNSIFTTYSARKTHHNKHHPEADPLEPKKRARMDPKDRRLKNKLAMQKFRKNQRDKCCGVRRPPATDYMAWFSHALRFQSCLQWKRMNFEAVIAFRE